MSHFGARFLRTTQVATEVKVPDTPSKSFPSAQSLGKAMKRVGSALPGSPRRRVCIVKKLANKFGLIPKQSQPKQPDPVMAETDEVVRAFFLCVHISAASWQNRLRYH